MATSNHDAEARPRSAQQPVRFDAVRTGRDDVALLGFTSGTTGEPKATMHFHRDLLIVADSYARKFSKSLLTISSSDRRHWHLRLASAASRFPVAVRSHGDAAEKCGAQRDSQDHRDLQATICFTAPTAYRAMLAATDLGADAVVAALAVRRVKACRRRFFSWTRKTGKPILDGINEYGIAAYLHHEPGRRSPRQYHRAAGFRLRGQDRRRRAERCRPGQPANLRCADRQDAAIWQIAGRRTMCAVAGI